MGSAERQTNIHASIYILYSYNTGTRDMTETYAQLPRHIPSKRVITVMFHTLEVESIVSIIVKL